VPPGLERLDRERRVLVEVVGQYDRVEIVREELLVVGVSGDSVLLSHFPQLVLPRVADGDQFHAGRRAAVHECLTAPDADNADTNRLPASLGAPHCVPLPSAREEMSGLVEPRYRTVNFSFADVPVAASVNWSV